MVTRKAIFITGGGSGIGRATAQFFAGRGWFVGQLPCARPGDAAINRLDQTSAPPALA